MAKTTTKVKFDIDLKKLNSKIKNVENVFKESKCAMICGGAAETAAANLRQNFYVAPKPYWHTSRAGRMKLQPGTVQNAFYAIRTPEKEREGQVKYKVGVYNNAETGFLGNVAVLIEYGNYQFQGVNVWRPEIKAMKKRMLQKIDMELKKAQTEWNK